MTSEAFPVDRCTLRLNPDLRWLPLAQSERQPGWLIELTDAHGRIQRLAVSNTLRQLLQRFCDPRSFDAVLAELREEGTGETVLAHLRAQAATLVQRHRLLLVEDDPSTHAHHQPGRPAWLSWMLPILPPAAVRVLAAPLKPLFSSAGLWASGLLVLLGLGLLLHALWHPPLLVYMSSSQVLGGIALCVLGVVLHELGHAAAALRFGARNVSVGIGWYTCFPVAYADLSELWAMPRAQRTIVDIAGVLLQGLYVLALMLLYQQSQHYTLTVVAAATSLSMLWNLNPLLRMDGYWLLSDCWGIANLRQQALRAARTTLSRGVARLRGARVPGAAQSAHARKLLAYGVASAIFFAALLLLALKFVVHALGTTLPNHATRLWANPVRHLDWADLTVLVGAFVWQLCLLLLISRFLLRCGRHGLRMLRRADRTTWQSD